VFDFIVVGAGSAGCVVAARLTEDQSARVLLLEAGGRDWRPKIHVPAAFPRLFKTAVDWQYHTDAEPDLHGRRLYWPRGKVLGGSSSINAMIYVRGHPRDYDGWAAQGNDGWAFADVLPYFKKAEHQQRGASDCHGVDGPLHVADLRCVHPLTRRFLRACADAGLPANDDFNGLTQDGAGLYQVTQKGGRRCGAAVAYLRPALRRPNLTVLIGAHAVRVLIENGRAAGVEYLRKGRSAEARAGEVVLCGGAVESPCLLLRSGVGPAADLERLGIPVSADLPGVGRNLQDHPLVGACYACTRPPTLDSAENLVNVVRFILFKSGPLTSNVAEAGAFVRTDPALPAPDVQLYFVPAWYIDHGFTRPPGGGFSLGACLLRPQSRGEVRLASRDPLAPPVIRPNYLSAAADLLPLVAGLRLVRRLARSAAFDEVRGEERLPGSAVEGEEELRDYTRRRLETLYHPAGTCKMGQDDQAVVDPQLRVRGVRGLRVADASVIPTLPGGNTNAPVIMIAEKAVDQIRGEAKGGGA
jgi:choline dehydrogenase